jgi:hypothetical protein
MKMFKLILILATMFLHCGCQKSQSQTAKEKLHVYLLIGQSNMAGRAPFTEEESAIIPECFLLNAEDKWQPATNPLNRYSSVRKSLSMQKMNPGYTFSQTMLTEEAGISLGLVVNAKGGTKIEQWSKGTEFYNEALRRVRIAQSTGTVKGILWHQGESNSKNPDGYLDQLKTLIENIRTDLGMEDLPFVAGQVFYNPETKPNTRKINEQIAQLPDALRLTGCVSIEDLTTADHTHFDSKSMRRLGQRYAREMLKLRRKDN